MKRSECQWLLPIELSDLAIKNTRFPVKFEFQYKYVWGIVWDILVLKNYFIWIQIQLDILDFILQSYVVQPYMSFQCCSLSNQKKKKKINLNSAHTCLRG